MAEPTHISYHDRDLDRAAAEGVHGLATDSVEMLDRESSYDVRGAEVVLGPLSAGRFQCAAAIRATASDIQTCYAVDLPGVGVRQTEHRSASTEAFRGRGVICQPVGDVGMRLGDGHSCVTVRIDREALEAALLELLDRAPGHPPDPQPSVNLRAPAGARWAGLVRLVVAAARSGALADPLVAAPLRDAVVRGMLVAAERRAARAPTTPLGSTRPRSARSPAGACHR